MMSKEKPTITGKSILVISPQRWGKMHVSKHHYAIELARLGNKVYFLNPPISDLDSPVEIKPHEAIENLTLVSYRLFFPYNLRFHLRWLYDLLMRWQIRTLLKDIGVTFDIAWCFDTNLFADLRVFRAEKVIYHLADQIMSKAGIKAAATADMVVSVDQSLLGKLDDVDVPKLVVGHGLAEPFAIQAEKRLAKNQIEQPVGKQIQVGYVGNLLISSLDRASLSRIIEVHNEVTFHFWGAHSAKENNVGVCTSPEVSSFIGFLQKSTNVVLHGVTASERLAEEMQSMDVFLLCYDVRSDINGGCNSHKILEYLSTGKVVVSNHMSSYATCGELIQMCSKDDNSNLLEVFAVTLANLNSHNSSERQSDRVGFAMDRQYNVIVGNVLSSLRKRAS